MDQVDEVLVVDDGSTDDTSGRAREAGAWVLRLPENQGKGSAIGAGVAAMPETDVYLLVDADLATTASGCGALLGPVLAGVADMTVGVLPGAGARGGFGLVRNFAGAGIHRACGLRAEAPLSGQRAVRGSLLRSMMVAPRFGLEAGLTIDAVRAGARVLEVPIEVDHHHRGRTASGFAHRANQGVDIMRALWPRLTSLRLRVGLIVLFAVSVIVVMLWAGGRWEVPSVALPTSAERVLIVGIPGLRWSDVGSGAMPNLDRLAARGALGAMTTRTASPRPGITEAYATLGAGSRVKASDVLTATPGSGETTSVIDAEALAAEAGRNLSSPPGALGEALHAAGLRTAVVGNADIPAGLVIVDGSGRPRRGRLRPALAALADREGRVDVVDAADLLMNDPASPFGLRADINAVVVATQSALDRADVVLVDPGDMTRVGALGDGQGPEQYRSRAIAEADMLVGRLAADASPDTLLMVISPLPPDRRWRLTPAVVAGPGVPVGELHSPSTRQAGLITLTDVAPTVLEALGVPVSTDLVGHSLRYAPGSSDASRMDRLDRDDTYRETTYLRVVVSFTVAQALVYLLTALAVRRRAVREPGSRSQLGVGALRWAVLAIAAFPLATFLFRGVPFASSWGAAGLVLLVGIDFAIVGLTRLGGWFRVTSKRPLAGLSWILVATVVVLVADVATGGRLQTASLMGYSPHVAGRYYGLGNTAFAALAASALLAVAVHVENAPRRVEALVSAAAFLLVVLVADGAPSIGDDVGGILTLVPIFGLTVLSLAGRRPSWRMVLAAIVATAGVLAMATALDVARPPAARTHLGRLAVSVATGGLDPLAATMARKAEVSLRILGGSPWTWVVPVIALALAELLVRRRRGASLAPAGSARRVGMIATLAVGVLGAVVNDSGVVVTALVLVYLGAFGAMLALAPENSGEYTLLEPVGPESPAGNS